MKRYPGTKYQIAEAPKTKRKNLSREMPPRVPAPLYVWLWSVLKSAQKTRLEGQTASRISTCGAMVAGRRRTHRRRIHEEATQDAANGEPDELWAGSASVSVRPGSRTWVDMTIIHWSAKLLALTINNKRRTLTREVPALAVVDTLNSDDIRLGSK